jgi:predicted MFS family arabinose efflux permease
VLFALWEVAYAKRGRNPLVPPRLYAHANFTLGTILALVYFAGFTSIFFSLSLFWQAGLHHTALETGLVSLPFAIGTVIGSQQSQRMAARFGRNALALGLALVTISLGSLWLILTNLDPTGLTNWILLPSMLMGGLGNGLFLAPNAQFIVATVERQDAGSASGVVNTMQRVGNAIGVAVVGSVLFGSLTMVAKTQQGSLKDIADGWANAAANGLAVSTALALLSFLLIWALPARVASGQAPAAPVGE